MGRTNPTFTQLVLLLPEHLQKFRRALRREEREVFDRLICFALAHAGECTYSASLNPVDVMLFSITLEQQKKIEFLESRIRELEQKLCV